MYIYRIGWLFETIFVIGAHTLYSKFITSIFVSIYLILFFKISFTNIDLFWY